MTDTSPNSPMDRLAQEVAKLRQEVQELNRRVAASEQFNVKILQTLKRGEETFELRVARAQYNVFHHVAHSLENTIDVYQRQLQAMYRGFDVEVVDGKDVKENAETILVAKTEDGYNFSRVADPENIMNEGTDIFVKYFEENPQVFGDRKELLINITTYADLSTMEPKDDQA